MTGQEKIAITRDANNKLADAGIDVVIQWNLLQRGSAVTLSFLEERSDCSTYKFIGTGMSDSNPALPRRIREMIDEEVSGMIARKKRTT